MLAMCGAQACTAICMVPLQGFVRRAVRPTAAGVEDALPPPARACGSRAGHCGGRQRATKPQLLDCCNALQRPNAPPVGAFILVLSIL